MMQTFAFLIDPDVLDVHSWNIGRLNGMEIIPAKEYFYFP